MKNILLLLVFVFMITSVYAQRPITFDKFALDDDKSETIKIIEKEYNGKYTVGEYGSYTIAINDFTAVFIYFEGDKVDYISVEQKNCTYAVFLDLINEIINKQGEPRGSYVDDKIYVIYWWAKNPSHDLRVTITLSSPFTVNELVFYGK